MKQWQFSLMRDRVLINSDDAEAYYNGAAL